MPPISKASSGDQSLNYKFIAEKIEKGNLNMKTASGKKIPAEFLLHKLSNSYSMEDYRSPEQNMSELQKREDIMKMAVMSGVDFEKQFDMNAVVSGEKNENKMNVSAMDALKLKRDNTSKTNEEMINRTENLLNELTDINHFVKDSGLDLKKLANKSIKELKQSGSELTSENLEKAIQHNMQSAVDKYNGKIDSINKKIDKNNEHNLESNSKKTEHNAAIDSYNRSVNSNNIVVEQYNKRVDQLDDNSKKHLTKLTHTQYSADRVELKDLSSLRRKISSETLKSMVETTAKYITEGTEKLTVEQSEKKSRIPTEQDLEIQNFNNSINKKNTEIEQKSQEITTNNSIAVSQNNTALQANSEIKENNKEVEASNKKIKKEIKSDDITVKQEAKHHKEKTHLSKKDSKEAPKPDISESQKMDMEAAGPSAEPAEEININSNINKKLGKEVLDINHTTAKLNKSLDKKMDMKQISKMQSVLDQNKAQLLKSNEQAGKTLAATEHGLGNNQQKNEDKLFPDKLQEADKGMSSKVIEEAKKIGQNVKEDIKKMNQTSKKENVPEGPNKGGPASGMSR